jgi:methionine biosynthesis protein MetW
MSANAMQRADFAAIANWIKPAARVLDLGCGDGTLLRFLAEKRETIGYGVEIDDARVLSCIKNGVNVVQGDMERGLSGFADDSFDYVILSQTLQAVKSSERVVREMLRVGRQGIVTFPNFGYWRNRLQVMFGNMPMSDNLPYAWFDTPNIHLCTLDDFENFCRDHGVRILERTVITGGAAVQTLPNLMGALAVFRFERA